MKFAILTTLITVLATAPALVGQVPNQANTPAASLVFAGIDHPAGGSGPITVSYTGFGIPMDVSGIPNSPFILATSPGNSVSPGLPTVVGTLHLSFAGLSILLDGFASTVSPLDILANTGPGTSTWTLPSCNPLFGTVHSWQALVADPGAPAGSTLTAASDVTANCGTNQALSLGDDASVQVMQGPFCPVTEFYNQTYFSIFVGSNGYVTFGTGDTNLSESQTTFDSSYPRIAGAWDDLDPTAGGTISYIEGTWGWSVVFSSIQEYFSGGSNNFAITYNCMLGSVTLDYTNPAGMTLQDAMAGITPGNGLASPVTTYPSLKTVPCGGTLAVPTTPLGPLESHSALYAAGFDLAGCAVVFQPASFGGPGSGSASSYVIF